MLARHSKVVPESMIKSVVCKGSWLQGRRKWRWRTICFTQSGFSASLVLTFVLMYHCEEWVRMKECVGNFAAWAVLSLNAHTYSHLNIAPPHLGQATQRQGDGAGWYSVTAFFFFLLYVLQSMWKRSEAKDQIPKCKRVLQGKKVSQMKLLSHLAHLFPCNNLIHFAKSALILPYLYIYNAPKPKNSSAFTKYVQWAKSPWTPDHHTQMWVFAHCSNKEHLV